MAMEVVRRAAEELVHVRIAPGAEEIVAAGIVCVAAVTDSVGNERDHGSQERQVAPQPMAGGHVRSVELSSPRSPESLARIVACPQVEVHDLGTVDRREPHDLPRADRERVTGSDRHDRLADRATPIEL